MQSSKPGLRRHIAASTQPDSTKPKEFPRGAQEQHPIVEGRQGQPPVPAEPHPRHPGHSPEVLTSNTQQGEQAAGSVHPCSSTDGNPGPVGPAAIGGHSWDSKRSCELTGAALQGGTEGGTRGSEGWGIGNVGVQQGLCEGLALHQLNVASCTEEEACAEDEGLLESQGGTGGADAHDPSMKTQPDCGLAAAGSVANAPSAAEGSLESQSESVVAFVEQPEMEYEEAPDQQQCSEHSDLPGQVKWLELRRCLLSAAEPYCLQT